MSARSRLHARNWRAPRAGRDAAMAVTSPVQSTNRIPGRAAFLDRDGTIIEEVGYLDRPERVEFFPWTIDAIRVLNRAGLGVVMVSNQSGIARGFFTEAVADQGHGRMAALLPAGAAHIDVDTYYPH